MPVTNTGSREGVEVVQAYLGGDPKLEGPIMSLRGFRRISIPAGKTVVAEIPLGEEFFKTYNPKSGEMEAQKGRYNILYGPYADTDVLKTIKYNYQ